MITESMSINSPVNIASFIEQHLRSSEHSWSIGIPGAIGEFMYDENEAVEFHINETQICATTPRGAMRIHIMDDLRCVAYEELSSCTRSWSQNVAFCIPENRAKLEQNNVLTYLGADENSINVSSRQKQLFDLGVDSPWLQFCIRTSDKDFLKLLKENSGRSIFESGNPVAMAVLENSPARVVTSALGRVEIETKIPQKATETLAGPHTHLLPTLLNSKKSPASEFPKGYVEVLSLYPEHPVFDKYGEVKLFQRPAYDNFQSLLTDYGFQDYRDEKNRINRELSEGLDTSHVTPGESSWQRRAFRIAKMQAAFLNN